MDQCADAMRLPYDGSRLDDRDMLQDYGVEGGDFVTMSYELKGGTPVIYLSAPEPMDATVQLGLVPEWSFSAIYPVAETKKDIKGREFSLGR